MEENIVLKTAYLDQYKSSGPNFRGNLYREMEVFLTRDQYELYSKIEIEGYDNKDILEKVGRGSSEDRYGKLRISQDIDLSMEDYLELINLELGYDFLPFRYKLEPIYINNINGGLEEVGNLADREIASLVLTDREGLSLEIGNFTNPEKSLVYKDLVLLSSDFPLMKYFMEIRTASLSILMDRNYKLEERLILLRVFYEHLDHLNSQDRVDLVPDKIEELLKFFSSNNYKNFFKSLPKNNYLSIDIVKYLLSIDLNKYSKANYGVEIKESLEGLTSREDMVDLRSIYMENKKIYDKWKDENLHILENYLVNEFFKEALPFSRGGSIVEAYNDLITDYIVLDIILLASSSYSGKLNDEVILDKITSYVGFKLENLDYIYMVRNFMSKKSYFNIESLSIIL